VNEMPTYGVYTTSGDSTDNIYFSQFGALSAKVMTGPRSIHNNQSTNLLLSVSMKYGFKLAI